MAPSKKSLIVNMVIAGIIFSVGVALYSIAQSRMVGMVTNGTLPNPDSMYQAGQMWNAGVALMSLGGTYFTITLIIFLIYFVFN
jgi:hypothetical protein